MAAPRRRSSPAAFAYRPLLRRAGLLLGISVVLSFALVAYLFGLDSSFFGRLAGATFVWFILLSVTFLAVVPFVNWAADNWFGRTWAEAPTPQPKRHSRPAAPRSAEPAAARPPRNNPTA